EGGESTSGTARRRGAAGGAQVSRRNFAPTGSGASGDSSVPGGSTVLDSLVDFDDYDTGFRPDGFEKPARS
ncbi:MAG TPA: hypothetical protein VE934_16970, partial [Polaromonas sp.]|uniref:hypothetical protein n=1 Tax=Polaromonas sp. TaxID=1869339 RepID=UPI002D6360E3